MKIDEDDWLFNRYLRTIEVLKKMGFWNLDDGLILLPYIQHCIPPPNTKEICQSMYELIEMEVNTDWFPLSEMKRIHKKFRALSNLSPIRTTDEVEAIGHDYPIHYGIHRIHSQRYWKNEWKKFTAEVFIQFVHENTGAYFLIEPDTYYSNVYSVRDALICIVAHQNKLGISGQHSKGLEKKVKTYSEIKSEKFWIGSDDPDSDRPEYNGDSFWYHAPKIPFGFTIGSQPAQTSLTAAGSPHNPGMGDLGSSPSREQAALVPKLLVKWARQNVRSEADFGALSLSSVFRYWEFLLSKSRVKQFLISVLGLAIGIPKNRWESLSSDETALKQGGLVISPTARLLVYKVQNIASDFSNTPADKSPLSHCIQLALPSCWVHFFKDTKALVAEGIREESSLRGYSRKNGGVTPTINRMARSGHALLRREFLGELRSHILAGNIPIELQNRSAYQAVSNQKINVGFQAVLKALVEKSVSHMSEFPRVHKSFQEIDTATFEDCSNHPIGSQLCSPSDTVFTAPKFLSSSNGFPLKAIVDDINRLELYYFWMQQFAMADRAVGELTETTYSGSVRWHRDKDSHEHEESKIHLAPDLLLQQFQEIQKARSYLQRTVATYGHELILQSNDHRAMRFKVAAQNMVKAKVLDSKTAQQKAAELWGYQPPYDRSNAHRHLAATWMADHHGEIHADILLGHHVDGWDLFAPESSASMSALEELVAASTHDGFQLIRSPWQ